MLRARAPASLPPFAVVLLLSSAFIAPFSSEAATQAISDAFAGAAGFIDRAIIVPAAVLIGGLLALFAIPSTAASTSPSSSTAEIVNGASSMSAPGGYQWYLYGFATGGAAQSGGFTYGEVASVSNSHNYVVAQLASTSSNFNSFSPGTATYTLGSIGVSGYQSISPYYNNNPASGATGVSQSFSVSTAGSLVVIVALAGGEDCLSLSGVPGLTTSSNSDGAEVVTIAYGYPSPNSYTASESTSACGTTDPQTNGDLIGVFVFTPATPSTASVTFSASNLPSSASGKALTVDGTSYTASQLPQPFTWTVGSTHTFTWTITVSPGNPTEYIWATTSGCGQSSYQGTIMVPSGGCTVSTTYTPSYQVTLAVNPSGDGTVSWSGGCNAYASSTTTSYSGNWYYATSVCGSTITLGYTNSMSGYTFQSWSTSGGVSVSGSSLTVSGVGTVTGNFGSPTVSTITLSPSPCAVTQTTGTTGCPLTISVDDQYGNPMSGITLTMGASTTTNNPYFSPSSPITGSNGQASTTVYLSASVVSSFTFTVTASAGGKSGSDQVTFNPAAPVVTTVSLSPNPCQVTQTTGTTGCPLTITVLDQNNNPMSGVSLTLTSTGSVSASFNPSSPQTGSNGQATTTVTLTGSVAACVTITVKATASNGVYGQDQVTFCPTPTPTVTTSLSTSSITIGGSVYDTATLSGLYTPSTGTIAYTVYTDNACTMGAVSEGSFSVTANGAQTPSNSFTPSAAGTYYWQAVYTSTDGKNNGASSSCTSEPLTVNSTPSVPSVSISPPSATIDADGVTSVTFKATPSGGSGSYSSYTWTVPSGLTASSGCTSSSTTCTVTSTASGSYTASVSVTDSKGATSSPSSATLTVNPALTVPSAPTVSATSLGVNQALTVTATIPSTGTSPYSWQWLVSVNGGLYLAATQCSTNSGTGASAGAQETCSVTANTLTAESSYAFELQVTDSASASKTSPASSTLTVVAQTTITVTISPSATIDSGQSVKLTISWNSAGTSPYSVQLQTSLSSSCNSPTNSGSPQTGITGASTTVSVSPTTTIVYCTTVTDSSTPPISASTSTGATITVDSTPTAGAITPSSPTTDSGLSVLLHSAATGGTGSFSYQWYTATGSGSCATSDSPISGAISSTYSVPATTPVGTYYYCYIVTDTGVASGSSPTPVADSPTDTVTINPAITGVALGPFTTNPVGVSQPDSVSISWSGGTSPFTIILYYSTSSASCSSSNTQASQATTASTSPTTVPFTAPSSSGTFYYCSTVVDSVGGSAPSSASGTTLTVTTTLSGVTVSPSPSTIDYGQPSNIQVSWSGGVSTYTITLYGGSSSSSCSSDTTLVGQHAGISSASTIFTVSPSSTTYYCSTVADSTPRSVSSPTPVGLTVNPVLSGVVVSPSMSTIDNGQLVTITVSWAGGTPAYAATLYSGPSSSSCSYDTTTVAQKTGISQTSVVFSFSPSSTAYYCATITDGTPTGSASSSTPVGVTINPALSTPNVTSAPSIIDSGQPVTISVSWSGGTSPYTVTLGSGSSSNNCMADMAVVQSPQTGVQGTSTTFTVRPSSTTYYCATVVDTTSKSVSSSMPATVTVNPPLVGPTVSAYPFTINQGQSSTLSSTSVTTGSPPISYHWYEESPGSGSFTIIGGATSSSYTFQTSSTTTGGSWTFYLEVTDAVGERADSNSVVISVQVPTLQIVTTSLKTAELRAPYSATLQANGGVPSYTWSIADWGTVQGLGLTLSSDGVLSGTPNNFGPVWFKAQVKDSVGHTATQIIMFNIVQGPTLLCNPQLGFVVAGQCSIPNAEAGIAYTPFNLGNDVQGGVPSFTFTRQAGSLPPGMTLASSGVVSGTPTQTGQYPFTVLVTDSVGGYATLPFSITVPPVVTSVSPITGSTAGGGTVTISGLGFTAASTVMLDSGSISIAAVACGSAGQSSCQVVSDSDISLVMPNVQSSFASGGIVTLVVLVNGHGSAAACAYAAVPSAPSCNQFVYLPPQLSLSCSTTGSFQPPAAQFSESVSSGAAAGGGSGFFTGTGTITLAGSFSIAGSASFCLSAQNFALQEFDFSSTFSTGTTISLTENGELQGQETYPLINPGIRVGALVAGPVVIVPTVLPVLIIEGGGSASITESASQASTITLGLKYTPQGGWQPTKGFQCSNGGSANFLCFQPNSPTISINGELTAKLGVEIELLFYDAAGPTITPDVFMQLAGGSSNSGSSSNPSCGGVQEGTEPGAWWGVCLGIAVDVGGTLSPAGYNVAGGSAASVLSFPLASTLVAGSISITPQNPSLTANSQQQFSAVTAGSPYPVSWSINPNTNCGNLNPTLGSSTTYQAPGSPTICSIVASLLLSSGSVTVAVDGTTASSTGTIKNGGTSVNMAESTGVLVSIEGSGVSDGTDVSVRSTSFVGQPSGSAPPPIKGGSFYDVQVAGVSHGTATICITNQQIAGSASMLYFVQNSWTPATQVAVSGHTICGGMPVSALRGTLVVVGPSPANYYPALLALAVISVVVVAAMVFLIRRRA